MMRTARLLSGCALGAVLTALASAAAAQSYQGTHTVVAGVAAVSHTPDGGPGLPAQTNVFVTTPEAVIEWRPVDTGGLGAVDFQTIGTQAFFETTPANSDYTVLNRIIPVDAAASPVASTVAFRGTTTALLVNSPGGNIWFYSPTGIVVGPTARFNVGSLILTTNDIPVIAGGPSSLYGPGGLVQLAGPAGSTAFVDVQAGAQLNATGANAYIALVAPRVIQGGLVQANGQIAYIAAEQVNMTINGGLFDFTLTVGTTDANGVVHTGTTTGPASINAADLQRISMVALPKNDAMTMLLAGSVGYTPAASAANEGSSVVLAAGFTTDDPAVVPANRLGSISIGDAGFTNRLIGYATDAIGITPGVATSFGDVTTLYAVNAIDATASGGASITAASTLALRSGQPGTGGTINLNAFSGGQVAAAGGFLLDAGSEAADYDTVTPFVDAVGGAVSIFADGGTIATPLDFVANVGAIAGDDPGVGGQGAGGTIDLQLNNGGIVGAASMVMTALGRGGGSGNTGGLGVGGTIAVLETSGQLDLDSLSLFAQGAGGDATVLAGDGSGGSASIDLQGQAQDLDMLLVDASAAAGLPTGPAGASGHASSAPDAVRLTVAGPASLTVQFGIELGADARTGIEVVPGLGGQAGGVILEAIGGGVIGAGSIDLHANTAIRPDAPDIVPVNSPLQQGGLVSVLADTGGSIVTQTLGATATANGHEATGSAGTATGGTAQVMAMSGGSITVDDGFGTGTLTLIADGYGAPGPAAADAFGGLARLAVEDGSVTAGAIELSASGAMAEAAAATAGGGFDATGGIASVELLAGALGTASISTGTLALHANGDARLFFGVPLPGGEPTQGDGGDGAGGLASLLIEAGALTSGTLLLESSGTGGASAAINAASPFVSGDGTGGTSHFMQNGGTAIVTTLDLHSFGQGGGGAPAATAAQLAALAGAGTGGNAILEVNGGTLEATDAGLLAIGTGATGMDHGGAGAATGGGAGIGGTARLQSPAGGVGDFTTGSLSLLANGIGGAGGTAAGGADGNGGDGTGVIAAADLADGSFALGTVSIEANGSGGNGATGGTGTGGQATFALVDASGPSGGRSLDGLTVEANGNAGLSGGIFPEQSDAGDVLLDVRVLDAASALIVNGSVVLNSFGGVIGAPSGVTVDIAGAPLNIGGNLTVEAGDIDIAAGEPLLAAADAFLSAERTFVSTGLVGTDSALTVQANLGVTAAQLSSGGTAFLSGGTGPLVVADLASVGEVTAFGASVDIRSLGALQFDSATATAGDLLIETVGNLGVASASATGSLALETSAGNIATGDLTAGTWSYVDAFGSASLGDVAAGTDAAVTTRSGDLTVGNVTAGDDLWLSIFGTNATRLLTAGNLVTTGLGADGADGPPELFGGPGPTGNVTRLRSSGSLVVGDVQSPGRAILVADAGTTTAGNISADEALIVLGHGDIALDAIATDGRFYVADSAMFLPNLPEDYDPASLDGLTPVRTSGGLTIGSAVEAGDITVAVAGIATAPSWTSAGGLLIDAGGQFASNVTVSAAGSASITADNGIDLVSLTSGGTTLLRSAEGAINVGNLLSTGGVTARGLAVDIASSGSLLFADARAFTEDVRIATDGGLTLEGAFAGNAMILDVGTTFSLVGQARADTIEVTSADIQLGSEAQLGLQDATQHLVLRNGGSESETFIGGEAQAGDYSLDRNEAARLFVDETITILADGDITIGDLAMSFGPGGTNIGAGGMLEISSPGEVNIIGDVALRTSGADDTFRIDPRLIALRTDTGSISMFTGEGGGGTPQGRLELLGDRIVAATAANIDQLETMTDLDAISELLGQPGGTGEPLSAGTIHIDVIESLFIQNSGASNAFADRRGFAASGVEIATESGATQIAINGRIITPGGAVTGLEVTPLISINGIPAAAGGQFHARSTINGCVIGQNCAPREPDLPELDLPTREDVESPVIDEGGGPLFVAPLIELAGTDPLITPPLVDEPITGVGNDDLWEPRCEPGEENGPCPEDDRQP